MTFRSKTCSRTHRFRRFIYMCDQEISINLHWYYLVSYRVSEGDDKLQKIALLRTEEAHKWSKSCRHPSSPWKPRDDENYVDNNKAAVFNGQPTPTKHSR